MELLRKRRVVLNSRQGSNRLEHRNKKTDRALQPTRRFSCILLTTACEHLANAAEDFTRTLFDPLHVSRYKRDSKELDPAAFRVSRENRVDFLFSFMCPVIIPAELLNTIEISPINFHPAPPRYPGIGSASYAIYNNDRLFGVTAHIMDEKIDAGRILRTCPLPIASNDTCETLFDRAKNYSLILFYELLWDIAQTGELPNSNERWTKKAVSRAQFQKWMTLNRNDTPEEIERKVRALKHSRLPGPFMEIDGERVELSALNTY